MEKRTEGVSHVGCIMKGRELKRESSNTNELSYQNCFFFHNSLFKSKENQCQIINNSLDGAVVNCNQS